jgi:predicted ester cyclase
MKIGDSETRDMQDKNMNFEIIKRFLDAENKRDWETWRSCLDSDAVYEQVGTDVHVSGADHYCLYMQQAYAKIPDWQFSITALTDNEDTVMAEFDGSGHYTGRFGDRFINRVPLRLCSVCLFRIKNDKIVFVREYLDQQGFEKQVTETVSI